MLLGSFDVGVIGQGPRDRSHLTFPCTSKSVFIGNAMYSSLPCALGIHTTTPQLGLCLSHPESGVRTQTWDLGRDMSTQLHDRLFSFIDREVLAQLDFIAVASGPGGFTSTRLGVVTARTLAQQLECPLFGISSLAAFAWHPKEALSEQWQTDEAEAGQEAGQEPWREPLQEAPLPSPKEAGGEKSEVLKAVHMLGRRGQVFGAIYGIVRSPSTPDVTPDGTAEASTLPTANDGDRLIVHQTDHVLPAEEWETLLQTSHPDLVSMEAAGPLGHTVSSVVELAALDYGRQVPAHWSQVYPFYGQSPV